MRALGFPVKKEEVRKILGDYDREGTGKIAYEDFVEVSELLTAQNLQLYGANVGSACFNTRCRLFFATKKGIAVADALFQ